MNLYAQESRNSRTKKKGKAADKAPPSTSCKPLTSDSSSVRLPTMSLHSTAKSSRWSCRHSSSCNTHNGHPSGLVNYISDQGELRVQRLLPFPWSSFLFFFLKLLHWTEHWSFISQIGMVWKIFTFKYQDVTGWSRGLRGYNSHGSPPEGQIEKSNKN